MRRRVVITGIGLISPVGLDSPSTWEALLAGRSGVEPITKFDASDYSCRIAAEVRGFEVEKFIDRKEARKMDTFSHYAVAATREALSDAGLTIELERRHANPDGAVRVVAVAAAMTRGRVRVRDTQPDLLDAVLQKLRDAGAEAGFEDSGLELTLGPRGDVEEIEPCSPPSWRRAQTW